MVDQKISQMPLQIQVDNSAAIPIVQAGANWQTTKAALLTGMIGQPIQLTGAVGGSVTIDAIGNIAITAAAGRSITLSPGIAGPSIGAPVGGGTANSLLFVDPAGDLGDSPDLQWSGNSLNIQNPSVPTFQAILGSSIYAASFLDNATSSKAHFSDGTRVGYFARGAQLVEILGAVDTITYAPGNPADWNGAPPTDVWIALDRIVAWIALNFPLLTPP